MPVGANRSGTSKPTKRRSGQGAVSVNCHPAAEIVSMIEEIVALQPQQQTHPLRQPDPVLDKDRNFRSRRAAEC